MAKRFIDTEIFNDSWFMNLSPEAKLFHIYLITNCDHAGIIDLNIRLAEFQTGIKGLSNSLETVMKQFGEKRLVSLGENYYFIPNFIRYQYSNGLSKSVKAQNSVINRLRSFYINHETLNKEFGNSLITVQDKDIDKDKDKDTDKRGVGENLDTDLLREVMAYFDFTEIKNPDKQSQLFTFLKVLSYNNQTENFKEQFRAYKKFKSASNQIRHSFAKFIGTIEEKFMDGGWNAENWVAKQTGTTNGSKLMTPKYHLVND